LLVSGGLSPANLEAAKTEPRILFHLAERNFHREASSSGQGGGYGPENDLSPGLGDRPLVIRKKPPLKRDWSVSLGAGSVAPNMFPAKYSFDINATPDCLNDYALFALNVAGVTNGQANIVGINQLYSGTGGICGANPNVNWAYNGSTGGGKILTSPVLSLDGAKVAYVESAAASAIFHVLTLGPSGGTVTNATAPTANGGCLNTTSCLKSVTLSSTSTATLASP
jgi:hypothetical protein